MGAPILSEALQLESRIDRVAVYRSGAIVTRVAELPKERPERIKLGPLPLSIDDGTLRVSILGADVEATDLRVGLEVPLLDVSVRAARPDDVREAAAALERLLGELARVDRRIGRADSLGAVARPEGKVGRPPPKSPAEARVALLGLREERLRALAEEREAVEAELREAQRVLADLRERERRAGSSRRAEAHELRKVVELRLRGEGGGGRVELSYLLTAARWAPSYQLRLAPDLSAGHLEVRAAVCQNTSEDWTGVALSLSTAQLRGWAELPELSSIRIGRQQPARPKAGWRPPPTGYRELFQDFDRARVALTAPEPEPEPEPEAELEVAAAPPPRQAPPMPVSNAATTGAPYPGSMPMAPGSMPMGGMAAPGAPIQDLSVAPAAAAPMPSVVFAQSAAAPARGGRARKAKKAEGRPAAVRHSTSAATEPPAIEAQAAMLDYGSLHLADYVETTTRGTLVLESRRVRYRRIAADLPATVDVDGAFRHVEQKARACLSAQLPAGCRPIAPSGFDYSYQAEGRVNARSDGVFHSITLMDCEVAAAAHFVVVPREKRDAFRFVRMDNPLDAPLLDGPVEVYIGPDYLLTSSVSEVPPRGVLRLGLGVEQRIKVARNTRFEEETSGLMGGKLDLHHRIEVELSNQLTRPAEIEVRERIPVLQEEEDDIRLTLGSVDPPFEAWEPEDDPSLKGGYRWRVQVEAGAKEKLVAEYTVRIASKNELVGGNRREE